MKIKRTILIFALLLGIGFMFLGNPVSAADCGGQPLLEGQSCCGGIPTSVLTCAESDNAIYDILILIINILTAGVGIAAVGGIVYASIIYATAMGSAEKVVKAKDMIINVIIGIVAYALMYALLNFIIPGGLFN